MRILLAILLLSIPAQADVQLTNYLWYTNGVLVCKPIESQMIRENVYVCNGECKFYTFPEMLELITAGWITEFTLEEFGFLSRYYRPDNPLESAAAACEDLLCEDF